jgi:hypothetical protein
VFCHFESIIDLYTHHAGHTQLSCGLISNYFHGSQWLFPLSMEILCIISPDGPTLGITSYMDVDSEAELWRFSTISVPNVVSSESRICGNIGGPADETVV